MPQAWEWSSTGRRERRRRRATVRVARGPVFRGWVRVRAPSSCNFLTGVSGLSAPLSAGAEARSLQGGAAGLLEVVHELHLLFFPDPRANALKSIRFLTDFFSTRQRNLWNCHQFTHD